MSILLDALRKSEKNLHTHEVPTIHSEDQFSLASEPLKVAPLALLLVAALFVTGWLVWRQYQVPAGSYQPPVTLTPNSQKAVEDRAAKLQSDKAGVSKETTSQPETENTVTGQRTPVESFQKPALKTPNPKPAKPAGNSNVAAKQGAGGSTEKKAAGQANARKPVVAEPQKVAPQRVAPQKKEPQRPAPIGYWELPDAIRSSVPEIKFSVLVYAKNPSDRFVLINGQRLKEGDKLPSGPLIEEIRRDGVIFSHRVYRFLVER